MLKIDVVLQNRANSKVFSTYKNDEGTQFKCPICKPERWIKINYIQETPTYITGVSTCEKCGNAFSISR